MKNLILLSLICSTAFAGYGGPMVIIDGTTQTPAAVTANHELRVIQSSPIPVTIASTLPVVVVSPIPSQTVSVSNFPTPSPTITVAGAVNATIVAPSPLPVHEVSPVPTQTITGSVTIPTPVAVVFASPSPTLDVVVTNFPTPVPTQSVYVVNPAPDPSPTITVTGTVNAVVASPLPISAASLPLPSGASTDAELGTINTTLGSPFQAGGSIGNSAFGISGTLPAFASIPTFNLGTLNGAATAANQSTIITALGSPFQAGGSIGNSSFGISGTLPAFAATPTFNLGTLNGAATAAKQPALGVAGTASADVITVQGITSMTPLKVDGSGVTQPVSIASLPLPALAATSTNQATEITALGTINTTLGTPFQAGGSIGNSSFGISGTLPAFASTPTFNLGTLNGAATATLQSSIITALGSPFQAGGSIGNSAFGISGTLPAFGSTPTFNLGTLNGAATAAKQPALGTAGTASADVITVQGITSMTPLKVDGSGVTQPVSIATAPVLVAGSAIIGKVGIDQTTPGTTNGVQVNAALPAGTNIIGKTSIDQTTPGTTNLVSIGTNGTVQTKAPLNASGSGSSAAATVSTVITLTAPANAVKAYLMNIDTSTASIRWAVNRTASATLGQQLQPGRDQIIETTHDISLCAESGTQTYDVQWITQ